MKSPFPGMDPYLEEHWRDVHASLIIYARDQLQGFLPGDLRARVEGAWYWKRKQAKKGGIYPDVRVVEYGRAGSATAVLEPATAASAPIVLHTQDELPTETYLEIIDVKSGNRVVTVVEFLSPSNKLKGQDQADYVKKQKELRAASVSLVEVDLLRSGERVTNARSYRIPPTHRTTYHVCIQRGGQPSSVEVYAAPLQMRLPTIQVPLRPTDKDVPLDLQQLIDQCYRNGRYDDIDYTEPLDPPLKPADEEWADALLREKGLRK